MTHKGNIVAAIDIGTTKIVTIAGRMNETGNLEILGMCKTLSKGVKRGVVLNIEEAASAIRYTLGEVEKQIGAKIKEAYVGIAGQHISSLQIRGYFIRDSYDQEITKEDTERLLNEMYKISIQPGEQIIHVIPQDYVVDNETGVKNPIGMFGTRLEGNYHVVMGQISSIHTISHCVDRVGIKVKQLILEPLAASAAVLTPEETEAGVALVDIGGGTTDIAVYHDDIFRHTAVIPFGGNVITKDITEGCSILNKYAELLKIQYGSALGDMAEDKAVAVPGIAGRDPKEISIKDLAFIIQSRMEEIIDAIVFQLEGSDSLEKLKAGIVLTGGGSQMRHLPQLFKKRTGLDVRIGKPNVKIGNGDSKEVNNPMYAASVGLLYKGFENILDQPEPLESENNVTHDTTDTDSVEDNMSKNPNQSHGGKFNKILGSLKKTIENIFDDDSDFDINREDVKRKNDPEREKKETIQRREFEEAPNAVGKRAILDYKTNTNEPSPKIDKSFIRGKDSGTAIKQLSDSIKNCNPDNCEQGKDDDISDLVYSSIYAPERVIKNKDFFIMAFIHTREQNNEVKEMAHNFDETLIQKAIQYLDIRIKTGTRLTYKLVLNDIIIEDNIKQLVWLGDPSYVEFEVRIPESFTGSSVVGKVIICIDTIPVGVIKFKIFVDDRSNNRKEPAETRSIKYRNAFISYSSDDREEVLKRVSMLPKLGVNYFCDLLTLKPGDIWSSEVYKFIEESDVFFLFWSSNAKRSDWVKKEWSYALKLKGNDESNLPDIIPIIIEGPPPPEPPKELNHLHFNDSIIYFTNNVDIQLDKGNKYFNDPVD